MGNANLTDYFSCTYAINLPERKDRRREIVGELERAGMPLSAGRVEVFPAIKVKEKMGYPSIGAHGCFLSHFSVLKQACERGLANVLIVEDDLVIAPEVKQNVAQITGQLRQVDWGIVYLGHIEKVPDSTPPKFVPFHDPVVTAHFYAVNGPVIPRLVEYLEQVQRRQPGDPLGGPMDFDGALTMFRQANSDILTLIAHPNLGKQRSSRSNIRFRWFDRFPVVRDAADLARVIRNYLRG